jgi:pimeloyl-ACP methyl ester carboxylesterase
MDATGVVRGIAARGRSPVPAIVGSVLAGLALAIVLVLSQAASASEASTTGSVLLAFGIGWGLMSLLSTRFSSQPQAWARAPGAILALVGGGLLVLQPGPAVMDVLGWVWPPLLGILAIWMVVEVRGHLHGIGRWLVLPVIATLLVFAVGGAIATVSAAANSSAPAPPGRMVDVGGHRLYLECTGSGSPTVVLQAGLGESSSSWGRISPAIAAATTICVYDRAGHGRSDPAGRQDGIAVAADLHTLLARANVTGPYVLVGHSSGGDYVRVFADRHPGEVAGMVLLDAQPADAFSALPDYPATYQNLRRVASLSPSLARIGVLAPLLGLPADQATPQAARSARDEILALPAALEQAAALTSIGDRPLIVVTAGSGQQVGWLEAQAELPDLSTNSVHRVLTAATHSSLIVGVDAPTSTQAILDVVASIRSGTALR